MVETVVSFYAVLSSSGLNSPRAKQKTGTD